MTDPVSVSVRIGPYALEVGTFTESYAAFVAEREDENVVALHDALAEEAGEVLTPVGALEQLQANAEIVTRKCERAHELSGSCPIPAGSGKTNGRHRLNRGGNRQANAALYRCVIVRMRWQAPTIAYVERRTAEGLSKKDIIRCLKRYVAREVYAGHP